jgi:CRP/FNR family transcriptional regulator, cyclic AMP receptor protein
MTGVPEQRQRMYSAAPSTEMLLRRLDLFAALAPDVLKSISLDVSRRHWTQGHQLFAKGDGIAKELFVILRGRVRLSMLSAAGREVSLRHIGAGEVLGEIAALGGTPRTATATALSDVDALSIPAGTLVRVVSTNPETALAVMRFLCDRLRTTTDQLETVALYGVEARLARFFLGIAVEKGTRSEITLTLTQEQLAELIGASRPKVSQALARFERAGAILRKGARYSLDMNLLRTVAHGAD